MVKIGDKIRILNKNDQYTEWVDKIWVVVSISRSTLDNEWYDPVMDGMALVDCKDLPASLYEDEFEVI